MSHPEHRKSHWPLEFDFYHVGTVLPSEAHFDTQDATWLSYSVHGDGRGVLLIGFHADQEPSLFAELGNILTARIATALAAETDGLNWISPPHEVFPEQIAKLRAFPHSSQTYLLRFRGDAHHASGEIVPIQALWIENAVPSHTAEEAHLEPVRSASLSLQQET